MASLPPLLQGRRARVALGFALALVALRALLPLALAWGIGWGGQRATGLAVEVGDVDLSLLRGGVALERVAVAGVGAAPTEDGGIDPEKALLRFERLDANLQWLALLGGRIRLADLVLARPEVRLELDRYGRVRLPEPPPAEEAEAQGAGEEAALEGAAEQAPADDAAAEQAPLEDAAEQAPADGTAAEGPAEDDVPEEATAEARGEAAAGTPAEEPEEASGWPLEVGRLAITGADLRVADPALPGPEPAVRFGFGAFGLADVRLASGSLGLGGVGLSDPLLSVRRDFVLLERPPAPEAPAPEPGTAPPASAHHVEKIAVERAEFTLLTDAGPLEVALAFEATDVVTAGDHVFPFRLDLEIGPGTIGISGEAGIEPPSFAGRIVWEGLPVPKLALAADPTLAGWLRAASAAGQLELAFGPATDGTLVMHGDARLDGFDFGQPDGDEVSLAWSSLSVALERAVLPMGPRGGPPRIDVARVDWKEPRARYTLPAPALAALLSGEAPAAEPAPEQVETAAAQEEADAAQDEADAAQEGTDAAQDEAAAAAADTGGPAGAEAPAPAPEPARIHVGSLTVTGGDLEFVDRTVQPPYEGRLARIEISAQDLRLPESRAGQVRLAGRAPGGAGFSLDGTADDGGRLVFELERLGLAQFDAYTASAVGYRARGEASLKTEVELRKQRVQVGNQLVLHDIGLLSTGGEAVLDRIIGMPVDLALALLRDLAGDIRLGIPLSVDRGGLRVSIGTVVADAVRRAIAGAVLAPLKIAGTAASPLKALGSALSAGDAGRLSIAPLEAVPGEATLTESGSERLATLAEFLAARPQVLLVLHGRSDESDRDGLAQRMLIEAVQRDEDLPEVEDAGFFTRRGVRGALAAMGRGETHSLDPDERALLDRYLEAVFVPPQRYDALALERARRLQDVLRERHGVAEDRIRLAADPERAEPGVRVALGAVPSA